MAAVAWSDGDRRSDGVGRRDRARASSWSCRSCGPRLVAQDECRTDGGHELRAACAVHARELSRHRARLARVSLATQQHDRVARHDVGVLVLSSLAGYGFARLEFPGRDVIFVLVLFGLAVPEQAVIIPRHQLFSELGLHNTYRGADSARACRRPSACS